MALKMILSSSRRLVKTNNETKYPTTIKVILNNLYDKNVTQCVIYCEMVEGRPMGQFHIF